MKTLVGRMNVAPTGSTEIEFHVIYFAFYMNNTI